jgi:hypothetical protein
MHADLNLHIERALQREEKLTKDWQMLQKCAGFQLFKEAKEKKGEDMVLDVLEVCKAAYSLRGCVESKCSSDFAYMSTLIGSVRPSAVGKKMSISTCCIIKSKILLEMYKAHRTDGQHSLPNIETDDLIPVIRTNDLGRMAFTYLKRIPSNYIDLVDMLEEIIRSHNFLKLHFQWNISDCAFPILLCMVRQEGWTKDTSGTSPHFCSSYGTVNAYVNRHDQVLPLAVLSYDLR